MVGSEEASPGVMLDYNESNEVVGVELLRLLKRSSNLSLSALQFETVWASVRTDGLVSTKAMDTRGRCHTAHHGVKAAEPDRPPADAGGVAACRALFWSPKPRNP